MENLINQINATLTGYVLLVLLVGTGLWFTVRTRFVQVRCLAEGFRNMFCRKADGADQHGLTSFQAVSTAIAAQVGTGNIVGAASAILVGGPGAIFWMWVIAFFGMATSYAETVLAMRTRSRHKDGKILGGPVFYIKRAFRGRLGRYLAVFFACALVIALGFAGVMVQANAIAGSLESATGVPPMVVGVVLVALCALVFLGGVRRVGRVSARVVPIMAFLFLGGAFVVLALRAQYIPATFGIIVHDAFAPQSIIGGTFGTALMVSLTQGAKRGLFSNEAGMGSSPHAHAQAEAPNAHFQGTLAMVGVFIDTFVVLTLNALVIISTLYTPDGLLHEGYTAVLEQTVNANNLSEIAFGSMLGERVGMILVAVSLVFFAFTSILGWYIYGRINVLFLLGRSRRLHRMGVFIYSLISLTFMFAGTLFSSNIVWQLSDIFNNIMVIPNVLAVLVLTKIVVEELKRPAPLN